MLARGFSPEAGNGFETEHDGNLDLEFVDISAAKKQTLVC